MVHSSQFHGGPLLILLKLQPHSNHRDVKHEGMSTAKIVRGVFELLELLLLLLLLLLDFCSCFQFLVLRNLQNDTGRT